MELGLVLNSERQRVRKIIDISTAFAIATGTLEIPTEWYQHLTETPEEAEDLRRSRTLEVLKSQAKHKLKGGWQT